MLPLWKMRVLLPVTAVAFSLWTVLIIGKQAGKPLPTPSPVPGRFPWKHRYPLELLGDPPSKILLFAYGRSGSTFTADIIHHTSAVYYVFEPLRKVYEENIKSEGRLMSEKMTAVLQGFFSCNFSSSLLRDVFWRSLYRGGENGTGALYRCYKYGQVKPHFRTCVDKAQSVCQGHSKVIIKTIRYSFASVEKLMTSIPDLAVIFLVRDPRAVVYSQRRNFGFSPLVTVETFAGKICQRMMKDIDAARELYGKASSRLRFLRYEDLAMNPVEVSKTIYRFLHFEWTPGIQEAIIRQTRSNDTAGESQDRRSGSSGTYGVSRDDSYKAANSWRSRILWEDSVSVENACRDVMQLLGYLRFERFEDLRNLALSNRGMFPLEGLHGLSSANL